MGAVGAVGRNYGEALFELATRQDEPEAVSRYGDLLEEIAAPYRDEPSFRRFLDTPRVELEDKKNVLRNVLEGRAPEPFLRFLFIVLEKRRQHALPEIAQAYRELSDQRAGRVRAFVSLAFEPDEAVRAEILEGLEGALGQRVIPHFRRNPALLGGAVVRVGDQLMDGSLRRRLEVLRRDLLSRKGGVSDGPAVPARGNPPEAVAENGPPMMNQEE